MGTAALAALAGALVEAPKLPVNDNVRAPFVTVEQPGVAHFPVILLMPLVLIATRFARQRHFDGLRKSLPHRPFGQPQHGMPQAHPTCVSARSRCSL